MPVRSALTEMTSFPVLIWKVPREVPVVPGTAPDHTAVDEERAGRGVVGPVDAVRGTEPLAKQAAEEGVDDVEEDTGEAVPVVLEVGGCVAAAEHRGGAVHGVLR